MNSKLAILLSLVLASGTALAAGDQAGAMEQGQQQQQQPSFSEVDADANGLISEEEAQGSQQLADNFDQADANADGYVNRSEYESMLGQETLQE